MKDFDEKDCLIKFGEFLRLEREKRKLTQCDVANMMGLSQPYWSFLERGERNIDFTTAVKYCKKLGVNMSDFIDNYL